MIKTTSVSRAIKIALLSGLTTGSINAFAAPSEQGLENKEDVEKIVITGSRKVGQLPTETLSPVDILGGDSLQEQGSFDLTDSLSKIAPSINTQRYPIADGTAFVRPVTLRNLSPDHTLVLVNGTRRHRSALVNLQLAPLGTVNQGSQGVDFSTFPSGAIKRVEVLRDGASAQYGSDAIAGVVNLILNDANDGFSISAQAGEYSKGDGERYSISANAGFALGEDGFVNVSVEHASSDITSRGNPRGDAQAVAAIVGAEAVPYQGYGQRWGDPDIESLKLFINSGLELDNNMQLYSNFSYMDNDTLSGFFYRTPVLPTAENNAAIAPRNTLFTDANNDGVADFAPQSLIDSIVASSLNPADYLTADSNSPSGFILLNPIHQQFPGGYSPLFGAAITDFAFVAGLKGESENDFSWDVRFRTAENEVEYVLQDSINPSLGRLSPTRFNPGTLAQEETSVNADFVKAYDAFNLAFGAEWREEVYKITPGDTASTSSGPTFVQFGLGSDGFQGFAPESAGSFDSQSVAAYVDIEGDISDDLSAGVALRYEDYDEFGDTLDWKVSSRYVLTEDLAIRATANTGFRAPTPGQVNTLNVTTTADSSGNLIPSGTYPVNHPISVALGSAPLKPEESTSYSLGLVYTPSADTTITLDMYNIDISDRVALQNFTIGDAELAKLQSAGVANASLLAGSNGNFFVNAFDSKVSGIDFNYQSSFALPTGDLSVDFRHNYNQQEVSKVKSSTINQGRVFDLENQVPEHSSVLTFDYQLDSYNAMLRFNRYGDWSSTGGLFGPGDGSDTTNYGSAVLVDIEFSADITDDFSLAIGAENIFDKYPGQEGNGVLQALGQQYAVTSPFGFNGAFWYLRGKVSF